MLLATSVAPKLIVNASLRDYQSDSLAVLCGNSLYRLISPLFLGLIPMQH
ncbi:hypothetical protein MUK42_14016 [Musa troglodytarum]|uniref:Uncharacterized protein n=1 Tax=Musa troglodytarum TaxID=320322 RepID=A0A9E7LAY0_9LILI|nr:hypothetical protein MUK42_14016 [Musa troglodytarum]